MENNKFAKGRIAAVVVIAVCAVFLVFFLSKGNSEDFNFLDSLFSDVTENGFKVTKVIDGDTIIVDFHDEETTIKLIGIDAPEAVSEEKSCPYGEISKEYLKNRLEGEYVDIEYDNDTTDSSGRNLAYIYIGNEMLNETLVKNGYAVFSPSTEDTNRYNNRLIEAQKYAQENKLGMWSNEVSDYDTGNMKNSSKI
ncbi:MAG TPA: thermonuclease family protein [Candidatus Limousia pullorum]|uniref:Thermonuclease family protein n=1 Tax=Candidatus Limousia pullorum TaxID=2840860 RepID=A0A9D1LYR2_9FIRM|nr:thermonuclease family protein [Candidatus Limousia pullorum]